MGGWLVRQGDTPEDARIKTLMFPFALFSFAAFSGAIFVDTSGQTVKIIGFSIVVFSMLLFMVGVVSNKIPVGYLLDVVLELCTVAACAMDLSDATGSYPFRSWAFVVLLLDCALVFKRY
eukprot:Hpha_TRINITY_DN16395_c1_g3::TRINITY_DN16395_c1_g3_i1::g.60500::m.60500